MAEQPVERTPEWRDGLIGVSAGTAFAALNLFHFSTADTFVRPGTWPRILFLAVGAALAFAAWHRRSRRQQAGKRGTWIIPFGIPLFVAVGLFVVTALVISHQRSQPVPMNIAGQLAGRSHVQIPKGDPVADLSRALTDWRAESNPDFEVHFALFAGATTSDDYVGVVTMTAYRNSPARGALADDYDDRITKRLLGDATNVDAGESLPGVSGHFRCGRDGRGKDSMVVCAFAHGVSAAVVTVPAAERDPRTLARKMVLDLLRA